MVQGTRVIKIIGFILLRLAMLAGVIAVALFTSDPFYYLNVYTFQYINPSGFFSMGSLAGGFLALGLALVFWSGVFFGALGKKIDYVFIALTVIFVFWIYFETKNVTPQMYLGLVGVAVLGNALGYMLKLGRERWWVK